MIMTFVSGKYRVNAESEDARELIKELAQCIKALTQDLIEMSENDAHKVAVAISRDLLDVYPAPDKDPANQEV